MLRFTFGETKPFARRRWKLSEPQLSLVLLLLLLLVLRIECAVVCLYNISLQCFVSPPSQNLIPLPHLFYELRRIHCSSAAWVTNCLSCIGIESFVVRVVHQEPANGRWPGRLSEPRLLRSQLAMRITRPVHRVHHIGMSSAHLVTAREILRRNSRLVNSKESPSELGFQILVIYSLHDFLWIIEWIKINSLKRQ